MTAKLEAVLFDLDGTLLDNDTDVFFPRYFERLAARVAHIMPAKPFIAHLLQATQAMSANDGQATNQQVFNAAFYPLEGHTRDEMEPIFLDFYAGEYRDLQRYTGLRPEARRVVQAAFDCGLDVVIATNPLFPAVANQTRLEWAGVRDFPYRLVTSYENSRACKPSLRYYRQILEAIGRPAEACLMVGNDAGDIVAGELGCRTFLITGPTAKEQPGMPEPTYRGTLAQVEQVLLASA